MTEYAQPNATPGLLTVRLTSGVCVLAKRTKYGVCAYTFANRKQANAAAAKHGGWVWRSGRPFFVRMEMETGL